MSALTATPPKREYKTKSVRYNSKSAQQLRTNKKVTHRQFADALKYATSLYNEQKEKGMPTSAKKVSEFVQARLGVRVPPRTITENVKNRRANKSPLKRGPKGNFDEVSYQNLQNAFESYIKIKQINAGSADITRDKLTKLINQCTKPKIGCDCKWLLRRLLKDSAIDLNAGKCDAVEQRRIMWTTYFNLKSWFNNWERDLLELGFAQKQGKKTIIPPDQLARILNVDETCLVMDGGTSQRGGRPAATFYSPSLPNLGKATIKSSVAITMITGSTAAGEPIPPHFQFPTAAKSDETQKVNVELERFFVGIKGKFGHGEEKVFPVTFGQNEKGGMDEVEFKKYFESNLIPLFPDVANNSCLAAIT